MKHGVIDGPDCFGAPEHSRKRPAQERCDAIQAAFRSDDAPGSPFGEALADIPPSDDILNLRLAEELDYARRMLDQMGDELAANLAVVMRHSVALQSVDIVGQMLGHIANVVRSSDPGASVDRIGMCDLKARLVRKSGI